MKKILKNNPPSRITPEMVRKALQMVKDAEIRWFLSGVTAQAPEVVDISWKGKIVGIDKKLKIRRKVK